MGGEKPHEMDNRKLITCTLLGVIIAVLKSPFQFPVTDYLIVVEVPILGIGYLLLGRSGATYTGLINGILQSAVKVSLFPYDLIFGTVYGLLVGVFADLLKVRSAKTASALRMTAALALASTVMGLSITYIFFTLNLSPTPSVSSLSNAELLSFVYLPIVIWGIISGSLGGFISVRIWERNLKSRFGVAAPAVS